MLYCAMIINTNNEVVFISDPFEENDLEIVSQECFENDRDFPVEGSECVIALYVE